MATELSICCMLFPPLLPELFLSWSTGVTTPRGEHVTCEQAEKVAILEYFVMRKCKNFHFATNPFFLVISPTFWFLEENRGSLRQ